MLILNTIMVLFFFTNGISYSKRFQKYEKYIFIVLVLHDITLTGGLIAAFFHTEKKIQKIEVASCTISMLMVSWFRLVLRMQRNYLHKTIAVLTEDHAMKYQTHSKVQNGFFIIIFLIMLSSVMIFLSPILRFITRTTVNYNDSAIYIAPYLFKFNDINSFVKYFMVVSAQATVIAFNANGCWSYVIFTCYMLCNLEIHIERINRSFLKMLVAADKENFENQQDKVEKIDEQLITVSDQMSLRSKSTKEKFNEIIRYQQFFHEHLKNFMKYMYWTYVGSLVWILLTLVLTMFAISQIPKDIFFLMKKTAILVNFVLVFYLLCYIGEAVSRLADSLLKSFYNTPWYLLPPEIRQNLLLVMIQSQKEFSFNIFGMFTINLNLFTKVVKIIYTLTNLLIASQNK